MDLATKLYLGLLFAFIGDYITQTNWMSDNKTKDIRVAALHSFIYHIPFAWLMGPIGLLFSFATHTVIDRYRLAGYVISLKNGRKLDNSNFGFPPEVPAWLSTWLMIIIDNIMHISINTISIWSGI